MTKKTSQNRTVKKTAAKSKPYEPTRREQLAFNAHEDRRRQTIPSPAMKAEQVDGINKLDIDHPDGQAGTILLMEALGTTSSNFSHIMLNQLANAATTGKETNTDGLNFMLSVISGIRPTDQMEAMLAAQMAAVHMATMTFARRLANVETIPQQDSSERAFNKLARTFTTQMEALNRYRGKGQQKMTVEHVHVHEGGQAIVGNVQGGGVKQKTGEQPHAKELTHAPGQTLGQNKKEDAVPVPRNG